MADGIQYCEIQFGWEEQHTNWHTHTHTRAAYAKMQDKSVSVSVSVDICLCLPMAIANDNKKNRSFAWYLASFCLSVICANAMQFQLGQYNIWTRTLNFLILIFGDEEVGAAKSTWNRYTCRQMSREFYIFNCPNSSSQLTKRNWFIFSHASTSANTSERVRRFHPFEVEVAATQRHDGRKNTAHQTEKTLNTHFKRVHTLREEKKSL